MDLYSTSGTLVFQSQSSDPAIALKEAASYGVSLQDLKLHGADFSRSQLLGMDLSGSDLYGAIFIDSFLERCDFSNCNLYGACFVRAQVPYTKLDGSDIRAADFTQCAGRGSSLQGCYWDGATIIGLANPHAQQHLQKVTGNPPGPPPGPVWRNNKGASINHYTPPPYMYNNMPMNFNMGPPAGAPVPSLGQVFKQINQQLQQQMAQTFLTKHPAMSEYLDQASKLGIPIKNQKDTRFPHTCKTCGSPAYLGSYDAECSNPGCKFWCKA